MSGADRSREGLSIVRCCSSSDTHGVSLTSRLSQEWGASLARLEMAPCVSFVPIMTDDLHDNVLRRPLVDMYQIR